MGSDQVAFQLLQSALNAAQLRQQVYANNIANISTPGYKRQDVQFETLLQNAMTQAPQAQVGEKYIPLQASSSGDWSSALSVQPEVVQGTSTTINNNGNNVDVDTEMAKLAANQIKYNGLVQDLSMRFSQLKTAINGG